MTRSGTERNFNVYIRFGAIVRSRVSDRNTPDHKDVMLVAGRTLQFTSGIRLSGLRDIRCVPFIYHVQNRPVAEAEG